MAAVRKPPYAAGSMSSKKIWRCRTIAAGLMKNTNAPSMASTAALTKNGRMGWVKNLFMAWLDSA